MNVSIEAIKAFFADEDGATAVEYGLMVALIAGVIILSVTGLGQKLIDIFTGMTGKMPTPQ